MPKAVDLDYKLEEYKKVELIVSFRMFSYVKNKTVFIAYMYITSVFKKT